MFHFVLLSIDSLPEMSHFEGKLPLSRRQVMNCVTNMIIRVDSVCIHCIRPYKRLGNKLVCSERPVIKNTAHLLAFGSTD